MNTQLDKVLNELKNLSSEVYPNIELPTDTVLASYEREIGFIFPEDSLYTTNFTEPLSYQDSAFLKLPKFP